MKSLADGGTICPSCSSVHSLVTDSRRRRAYRHRRHLCVGCGAKYSTVEVYCESPLQFEAQLPIVERLLALSDDDRAFVNRLVEKLGGK